MSTIRTDKKTDFFKPVVRIKDMSKDMYTEIEKIARECIENPKDLFSDQNEIANHIKKALETKYGDKDFCWHVIIGRNFGGCLTHKERYMAYFYINQIGFLIFATPEV